jgi:hypothetical protein
LPSPSFFWVGFDGSAMVASVSMVGMQRYASAKVSSLMPEGIFGVKWAVPMKQAVLKSRRGETTPHGLPAGTMAVQQVNQNMVNYVYCIAQ